MGRQEVPHINRLLAKQRHQLSVNCTDNTMGVQTAFVILGLAALVSSGVVPLAYNGFPGFPAPLTAFPAPAPFAAPLAAPVAAPVAAVATPVVKAEYTDAHPQYAYAYSVQDNLTGDSKAQEETRDGAIVRGSYTLLEPDGTRRLVNYYADPINGFNAVVHRGLPAAVAPAVVAA